MIKRLVVLALFALTGCSKSSPGPEFYVSASVGGNGWNSNVANSQNTNVAAIISQNSMVVVASQNIDNTVTSLGVVFPKTITLNQPIAINPAQGTALAYSITQTEGYSADPARGGSGTLTVTQLDETAGIVAGTFSGDAVNNLNGSRIKITNGQFRSVIYKVNVTTPPPGKK